MPVETKERRTERLVARVSGTDKDLLTRAASMAGQSVATFVIHHAREVARQVIADSESIPLNSSQSRRLVEALMRPAPPVPPRLKKALAAHRQRVAG